MPKSVGRIRGIGKEQDHKIGLPFSQAVLDELNRLMTEHEYQRLGWVESEGYLRDLAKAMRDWEQTQFVQSVIKQFDELFENVMITRKHRGRYRK